MNTSLIWLTGLPSAGKTTIASHLTELLLLQKKAVEHLDGDSVRSLFPQTGFSREERDLHIKRIGYLASILNKHKIHVVASFISPYRESRDFVRNLSTNFVEVYVSTPLNICEARDAKGLYKKARKGEVLNFTGIDAPYEAPLNPEVTVDHSLSPLQAATRILEYVNSSR
jgi:adenylylsulfate kinase